MSMQGYNSSHSGEELDESIDRYGDISKNLTVFKDTLKELSDKVSGKVISIGAGDSTHDFGLNSAIKNLLVKGANGITTYLQTNADGTTYSLVIDASLVQSGATEEEIKAIIEKWLKEHPEATTTVADGSITLAKLSTDLKNLIQSAGSGSKVEIYITEEEVSDTYINYEYGVRLRNSKNEIISQDVDSLKITGATSTTAGLMTAVQVRNLASAISSITTLRNDLNWLSNKVQDIEEKGGGYQKPSTGIPASDLSQEVQNKLNNPAFPEAPTDGKIYGRKSGAWTEISEQTYTALAKNYAEDSENSSIAAQEAADNAFSHSEQARQSMDEAKAAKNAIDATVQQLAAEGKDAVDAAQNVQIEAISNAVLGQYEEIDLSGITRINQVISADKWSSNSGSYGSKLVPIVGGATYKIIANDNVSTKIAFQKTDAHSYNSTPDYAEGSELTELAKGTSINIVAPSDARYLYVYTYWQYADSGADRTPKFVGVKGKGMQEEISEMVNSIEKLKPLANGYYKELQITGEPLTQIIKSGQPWSALSGSYGSLIIPIEAGKTYKITANDNVSTSFAFLTSNSHKANTAPDYAEGVSDITEILKKESIDVTAPSDARYLYIYTYWQYQDSGADRTPSFFGEKIPEATKRLEALESSIKKGNDKFTNPSFFRYKGSMNGLVGNGWSVNNGILSNSGVGKDNRLLIDKDISIETMIASVDFKTTSNASLVFGARYADQSSQTYGVMCDGAVVIDFANGIAKYMKPTSGALTGLTEDGQSQMSLSNIESMNFRLEIKRVDRKSIITLYNKDSYEIIFSFTKDTYWRYRTFVLVNSGNIYINDININADVNVCGNTYLYICGDSITQGVGISDEADRWTTHVKSYLPPYSTIISGAGGATIDNIKDRMNDEVAKISPRYVMVTIGTNGSPTKDDYDSIINSIVEIGAIPIINHIPANTAGTHKSKNAIIESAIEEAKNKGVEIYSCRFDIATSSNFNINNNADSSLFSDGTHPNANGATRMANRVKIDLPWLLCK